MMDDGCCGNSLVDEDVGQVLDGVHGGHIDHDLGVGSVLPRVHYADVPPVHGHKPNIAEKSCKFFIQYS